MRSKIKLRRGTEAQWIAANPVLASGEPSFVLDTNKMKIGDGTTIWTDLPYIAGGAGGSGVSLEEVQDNLGNSFLVGGTGINLNYSDAGNSLTVNVSGLTSSNITDFSSSVSGLLPVKSISNGTYINAVNVSGNYTLNSTGQANQLETIVFNKTASSIPKLSVVYINGGQGDRPTVQLAIASTEGESSKTYGITAQAIASMNSGIVIVAGALTGVNTDQFNPIAPMGEINGTTLYLSPTVSGGLTTTKPSAPNHVVSVGTVVRTHQNQGVVEVRVINGFEIEELHNVKISGVAHNDILVYNSGNSLWENKNTNVFSNTAGIAGSSGIKNIVQMSQASYDSIGSGNYDAYTLYVIK